MKKILDLPTASICLEAYGVKVRIWADANRPVYHVEIDSLLTDLSSETKEQNDQIDIDKQERSSILTRI